MEEQNKILCATTERCGPYLEKSLSDPECIEQDSPAVPNIEITPLRQIHRNQSRERDTAVLGDLLHQGETMMVTTPPLLGRHFSANLALTVAGFSHWGSFPVKNGRVLHVVAHEPSRSKLLDHYLETGLDLRFFRDNIDIAMCRESLRDFIEDRLPDFVSPDKYKLIILDPFRCVYPNGTDTPDTDVGEIIRMNHSIACQAKRLDCGIVMVTQAGPDHEDHVVTRYCDAHMRLFSSSSDKSLCCEIAMWA